MAASDEELARDVALLKALLPPRLERAQMLSSTPQQDADLLRAMMDSPLLRWESLDGCGSDEPFPVAMSDGEAQRAMLEPMIVCLADRLVRVAWHGVWPHGNQRTSCVLDYCVFKEFRRLVRAARPEVRAVVAWRTWRVLGVDAISGDRRHAHWDKVVLLRRGHPVAAVADPVPVWSALCGIARQLDVECEDVWPRIARHAWSVLALTRTG